ncbi:MAG: hypothetical protein FJX31_04210 [Alphaproteobacteria bacterium]|nr:hypothetical protein [Alphaproteobacteria bacterium]
MSQWMYETGEYLENNPGWHSADAPFKAGWVEAILSCNAVSPGKLVEVSCGAGEILVELAKRYPEPGSRAMTSRPSPSRSRSPRRPKG